MIFTDDDLKRLKEDLYKDFTGFGWPHIQQPIEALLSRLEAAEAIVNNGNLHWTHPLIKAWRKAKGEDKCS